MALAWKLHAQHILPRADTGAFDNSVSAFRSDRAQRLTEKNPHQNAEQT